MRNYVFLLLLLLLTGVNVHGSGEEGHKALADRQTAIQRTMEPL